MLRRAIARWLNVGGASRQDNAVERPGKLAQIGSVHRKRNRDRLAARGAHGVQIVLQLRPVGLLFLLRGAPRDAYARSAVVFAHRRTIHPSIAAARAATRRLPSHAATCSLARASRL